MQKFAKCLKRTYENIMLRLGQIFKRHHKYNAEPLPSASTLGDGTVAREIAIVRSTPIFDENWYRHKYIDLADKDIDLAEHYVRYGASEARDPGPFFSTSFYMRQISELEISNPLVHFLEKGARENLNPSQDFDISFYSTQIESDNTNANLLEHYIRVGRRMGLRTIPAMSGWEDLDVHEGSDKPKGSLGGVTIAVPLYKNSGLIAPLFKSIVRCAEDLRELNASILLIVDSPDDQDLRKELERHVPLLKNIVSAEVLYNEVNIGFVRSCNIAMHLAVRREQDLVLLNSDVEVFPGALKELALVAASDHMIGFVSPRSNNATICSIPVAPTFRVLSPEASYHNFEYLRSKLSRVEYVPTVVGFALYIKYKVLVACGGFDPIYGRGYNEENDLIMRANRLGYCAAIANYAFIYHIGETSFGLLETGRSERDLRNARTLQDRYPEYAPSVQKYFDSASYKSIALLDGLVPDSQGKLTIAFDWTTVGEFHNGTFRAARCIVASFARRFGSSLNICVIATPAVYAFHKLAEIGNLVRLSKTDETVIAALIRIGQPFDAGSLAWARQRAPIFMVFMLDTIAIDCLYLSNNDTNNLSELWQTTLSVADVILFNSEYTKRQFAARFNFLSTNTYRTALHSVNSIDYKMVNTKSSGDYILVVGNRFLHKGLAEALHLINAKNSRSIKIFGVGGKSTSQVEFIESGALDDDTAESLYANSACIVFPSHYEGFGFPIMTALAYEKPVLARRMPVFEEIKANCPEGDNIYLFDSTREMLDAALNADIIWDSGRKHITPFDWDDTAAILYNEFENAGTKVSQRGLIDKLRAVRLRPSTASMLPKMSISAFAKRSTITIDSHWQDLLIRLKSAPPEGSKQVEIDLISLSPFFDPVFYLATYADIREAGVDPVAHFCEHGWKENRNPSVLFDTERYGSEHRSLLTEGENPLIHYMRSGIFLKLSVFPADGGNGYALSSIIIDNEPQKIEYRDAG